MFHAIAASGDGVVLARRTIKAPLFFLSIPFGDQFWEGPCITRITPIISHLVDDAAVLRWLLAGINKPHGGITNTPGCTLQTAGSRNFIVFPECTLRVVATHSGAFVDMFHIVVCVASECGMRKGEAFLETTGRMRLAVARTAVGLMTVVFARKLRADERVLFHMRHVHGEVFCAIGHQPLAFPVLLKALFFGVALVAVFLAHYLVLAHVARGATAILPVGESLALDKGLMALAPRA